VPKDETADENNEFERRTATSVATGLESPPRSQQSENLENGNTDSQNGPSKPNYSARSLLKSASISASKCVEVKPRKVSEVNIVLNILSCLSMSYFLAWELMMDLH
jgi:hypothetical protein